MMGLALLAGGAYLLVYVPLMWPVEGDSEWFTLVAPLPVILVPFIWSLL